MARLVRAACLAALVLAVPASSASAATRLVDDDKVECPNAGSTTIQGAVDDAEAHVVQPGDEIAICPGLYVESLVVNSPLTLRGAGADRVRIQAPSTPSPLTDYVLHATGGPVDIAGVTITAGALGATPNTVDGGVRFEAGGSLRASRITNLAASASPGQGIGVFAEGGAGATYTIEGSLFEGYGAIGISIESGAGSLTANVQDNVIHGRGALSADAQDGILVNRPGAGTATVTIERNLIADHRHTPDEAQAAGVRLRNAAAGTTIEQNDIQGNGYGVWNEGIAAACPAPTPADAENNWWGNPAGATEPSVPLCPVGPVTGSPAEGDRVSPMVDADPFRSTPRGASLVPAQQADDPPTVAITSPADGAEAEPGSPVTVSAAATDDFDVKRVEFRRGATLVATDTTPPYSAAVNAPAAGTSQVVTATAVDSSGQAGVAAISVRGTAPPPATPQPETPQAPAEPEDRPPTVAITGPAPGAQIDPAAAPRLSADAGDDRGVARVVFLDDGQQVCSDDTAPYDCAYAPSGGDVGRNTLIAIAVDGAGQGAVDFRNVEVRRFNPKLTSRTSPKRDRRRPYRYTTTGSVLLPVGVTPAQACSGGGSVAIEFRVGKLRLPQTATLRADCSFRTSIAFPSRRSLGNGRIAVSAKFGGNTVLGTAKAPSQKVRAG